MESHAAVSFAATETGVARLALGDCLELLRREPSASVDLVYVDPPFNTGRVHTAAAGQFDDRFDSLKAYLGFLEPRLRECHRVLRATGSILVHCDWRTSHRVRCLLDDIFGVEQFVNHLVWSYGLGGSGPRSFARKHDDILFYGRTREYWFEAPRVAATSRRLAGMTKKATDVLDVPAINNLARERTGYPTQKPIALLSMLVEACCAPGGVVLDPCCGSGTSLVAALASGRRGIGFDSNPQALAIAKDRLTAGEWATGSPSVAPRRAG